MALMAQVRAQAARVIEAGRRFGSSPEWPLVAGAVLGALSMIEVVIRSGDFGTTPSLALLLGLCATVPVSFARGHVLAAGATIAAATLLTLAAYGRPTAAGLLSQLVVFFLAGRRCPSRAPVVMLLPFLAYAIFALSGGSVSDTLGPSLVAALSACAVGIGIARRIRAQGYERDAAQRAFADTLLENVARGERARIARELHDVVAHHISMVVVQAETARLATPRMPDEGAERLVAIGDTARAALIEMRRLLGILREDAGTETTRIPQPGLQQLIELIDDARSAAGASTRLIVHGCVAPLDSGVELTAFRIVQESLTNARRHAPGAAVDVELDYTADALCLRIRDNGPGLHEESVMDLPTGHGLLGMRERAAMVGGALRTGPAPGSGFLVEARLPTSRVPANRPAQ
jgi:signal transduction histidine kinase